jgi:hypothetical protein
MSQANAAAIKRRANPNTAPLTATSGQKGTVAATPPTTNMNNTGLTLPQVISLVDKRLIQLESFMNESKSNTSDNHETSTNGVNIDMFNKVMENMTNEVNGRFEILADEIANLKEIVLKLQSYTMDVNRSLLEERGVLTITNTNMEEENIDDTPLQMESIAEDEDYNNL